MTILARMLDGEARPPHEWLAQVRPQERAPADRPYLLLNMVATADGRASRAGRAHTLGSEADTELLVELRGLADAVLIGSGTLRAEGYARLVSLPQRVARRRATGLADTPLAVLLSRSLDLPWDAGLFAAPDQPVLIYTAERTAAATSVGGAAAAPATPAPTPPLDVAAPVKIVALPDPSPAAAVADLRRRGVLALLCEGGPTLNRSLFAAGLVDELFLTLTPLITADNTQVRLVEGVALPEAAELSLLWTLRHGDELFLRYAVRHGD